MTRVYGMSTAVGPLSFGGGQSGGQSEDGESGSSSEEFQKKPYSRKLAALIDQEVSRLVREAQAKTDELLRVNRGKLDTVIYLFFNSINIYLRLWKTKKK
jgi:cell division protease FtsH